jgi:hypothetical protein
MKEDRITTKEEVWATPKHLHAIPTTRGNFSSKIGKSGGGRREIEWGLEGAAPSVMVGCGHGEDE